MLTAEIRVVATNEGGRKTPFFSGYRPQFYFEGEDYDSILNCIPNERAIAPGEKAIVELMLSEFASTTLQTLLHIGADFELREGNRVIARGQITRIDEAD